MVLPLFSFAKAWILQIYISKLLIFVIVRAQYRSTIGLLKKYFCMFI